MPTAYYQCSICRACFKVRYKSRDGRPNGVGCQGNMAAPHPHATMTYRGDAEKGRANFPHGRPPLERNCE